MDGWTDERTNGQRTDGWTNRETDRWIDGRMDGWTDGQVGRRAGRQAGRQTEKQRNRQTNERMDRRMDRQTDRHDYLIYLPSALRKFKHSSVQVLLSEICNVTSKFCQNLNNNRHLSVFNDSTACSANPYGFSAIC